MAAPAGNQNAAKAKIWSAAISRVLENRTLSALDKKAEIDRLAEALVDKALSGDLGALVEIGNRLEGKAVQPVGGDDSSPPVKLEIGWKQPKS